MDLTPPPKGTGTMTTTHAAPPRSTDYYDDAAPSGWVGFAAIMLAIGGFMRIFDAIWAFRYHGAVPQNLENALFGHSLKTYGWIYLVVAAVLLACSVLLYRGSQFARWIGVFAATVAAISAIWWMPYYPVWSLMYIGLGGLVVYALVAHGGKTSDA
jgi:hypothetical protein